MCTTWPTWPDPERFDPERFAPHRREDKAHRHAYVPFGSGAHTCIGMPFGTMEVKAVLHQLLRRFTLHVERGYRMPADRTSLPRPGDGLPLALREPRTRGSRGPSEIRST